MSDISLDYIFFYTHKPSTEVPFHSHKCYELAYYYSGNGTTKTDLSVFEYQANTYFLYRPGVPHNEVHNGLVSVLCIGFFVQAPIDIELKTGIYEDSDKSIMELLERIRLEFASKRPHYNVMSDLLTAELLIIFDRQQNKVNVKFDEMYYIKRLMNENFNQDIQMSALVEISGYSYDHFRHIFKLKTGLSPKNYILSKRIEYARKLLETTRTSISEIAQTSGFCSSSQFGMLFKKHLGISPSKYRNKWNRAHKDG